MPLVGAGGLYLLRFCKDHFILVVNSWLVLPHSENSNMFSLLRASGTSGRRRNDSTLTHRILAGR